VPDDELLFDWDNANTTHIGRHKVTPMEAEQVLRSDPFDLNYEVAAGEERWTSIGHTDKLRTLIVVWAIRGNAVRVITAREASKSAEREYLRAKGFKQ
jgi:uncharacterized DUF497 family protein